MSITGGPDIVENGLVLYLDAGNPRSYPGSGTTWSDVSGNNYSGSLTNGPTFDSGNGGSILFDGVDDYVINTGLQNLGSLIGSGFTISYWINTTTTATVDCVVGVINSGTGMNFAIHLNEGDVDTGVVGSTSWYLRNNGGSSIQGYITQSIYDGNWHHMTWRCPSTVNAANVIVYIDAVPYTLTVTRSGTISGFIDFDYPVTIGARNNRGTIARYTDMKLANFMWYTRGLTATEVLQNYNATRSRFGL